MRPGARVLELGSGPGFLAERVLERCPQLGTYTLVDFSFGFEREKWSAELFIDNVFDERVSLYRYSECDVSICSNPTEQGIVYGVVTRPRMVGLKFSQRF